MKIKLTLERKKIQKNLPFTTKLNVLILSLSGCVLCNNVYPARSRMAPVLFPSSVKYWYPGSRFQLSLQLCHIIIMFLCPSISNAAVDCVCVCVLLVNPMTHTQNVVAVFFSLPLPCVCALTSWPRAIYSLPSPRQTRCVV